ncbi:HD domain-containing protein [Ilyobacter polytropus]|uniref:Metal dependent phosphohydrolase n=1 Tax=Ilyobacter polytropus (strain ATCC 51220 / DSM 2926 / LMG 16218 / CuHBu1) TaxID=572544 RepID=E3H8R5_ILYPC|nr:HD domain-containing protein [Ilyobacter polytropus]ADO83329.1 putative metal dependent phosphohydrolase [Ilyobacter polytropus DSM 2926]
MFYRIRQVLTYIFAKYEEKNNKIVRKILSEEEYEVFSEMKEYDKIHSVNLLKEAIEDKLLKNDKNYLKLALLHDCGKEEAGLFSRIKQVSIGDEVMRNHPERSYKKLLKLNRVVAELARSHHMTETNEKMKRFQEIDDRN